MDTIVKTNPSSVHCTFESRHGVKFSAHLFGGRNWSLQKVYPDSNVDTSDLKDDLARTLKPTGARRVFGPTPSFDTRIVQPNLLTDRIPLCDNLALWRKKGLPADGIFLPQPGDAAIISSAGCAAIVATYFNKLIVMHAARDGLVPPRIRGLPEQGRPHDSVVDAIIDAFKASQPDRSFDPNKVEVWIFWAIEPEIFLHELGRFPPVAGEEKAPWQKVTDYVVDQYSPAAVVYRKNFVGFNLPVIITEQFAQHKVYAVHDTEHTYIPDGFATTRSKGPDKDKKNLTGFVRHL